MLYGEGDPADGDVIALGSFAHNADSSKKKMAQTALKGHPNRLPRQCTSWRARAASTESPSGSVEVGTEGQAIITELEWA